MKANVHHLGRADVLGAGALHHVSNPLHGQPQHRVHVVWVLVTRADVVEVNDLLFDGFELPIEPEIRLSSRDAGHRAMRIGLFEQLNVKLLRFDRLPLPQHLVFQPRGVIPHVAVSHSATTQPPDFDPQLGQFTAPIGSYMKLQTVQHTLPRLNGLYTTSKPGVGSGAIPAG